MKKFGILLGLLFVMGVSLAIQPAENWNAGTPGKYTPSANANVTTEGGNVTPLNLSGNVSTEKWAGYWGNVSGNIVLSPGTDMFYTWSWSSAAGGEVCAIAAPSGFAWSTVQAIATVTIDNIWTFTGTDTDSATSTLTSACNVDVAGNPVTSVGTTTGGGAFETCAVGDGDDTLKEDVAFCVNITQAGSLFNGQSGDYELLAATDEDAGTTETHYFWLEMD